MTKFKAYYKHGDFIKQFPFLEEIGVDNGPEHEEKMLGDILPTCFSITQEHIKPDMPVVVLKCYGTLEEFIDLRKKHE